MELNFGGKSMRSRIAAAVVVVSNFLLPLHAAAHSEAEPVALSSKDAAQEFFLAVPLPSKDRLTLVTYVPITVGGEVLGGLAAYDDAATSRPDDYLELYSKTGDLLAVSWFDAFGIERLAVDRALVEDAGHLRGTFVLLITGHSV
jgi:hypothetical protein